MVLKNTKILFKMSDHVCMCKTELQLCLGSALARCHWIANLESPGPNPIEESRVIYTTLKFECSHWVKKVT